MFGQYTYLVYVLVFCLIPIGWLWILNFRFLLSNWRIVVISTLVMFIYLCATDTFAEAWRNWFFSSDRMLGWMVINFPIEEALFFLLVPVAVASATLCYIHWLDTINR